MIQAFIAKYAAYIGGGLLILLVVGFALWQIKSSGKAEMRAEVLEQTIETTNTHVHIEEMQSEIHNRTTTDAELFDSLRHGTL